MKNVVVICITVVACFFIASVTLALIVGTLDAHDLFEFLRGNAIPTLLGAVTVAYLSISQKRITTLKDKVDVVQKQTNGTTSALIEHNAALIRQVEQLGGHPQNDATILHDSQRELFPSNDPRGIT